MALYIALVGKLADYSLRSPFCDLNPLGDFTNSYSWVAGNADQHVSVVS